MINTYNHINKKYKSNSFVFKGECEIYVGSLNVKVKFSWNLGIILIIWIAEQNAY